MDASFKRRIASRYPGVDVHQVASAEHVRVDVVRRARIASGQTPELGLRGGSDGQLDRRTPRQRLADLTHEDWDILMRGNRCAGL